MSSGATASLALSQHAFANAPESAALPFTVSINIEIMFPRTMPRAERLEVVAAQGMKAFSFWHATEQEQDAMLEVMSRTGLKCASVSGTAKAGGTTGLTRPRAEQAYLDEITEFVKVAKKMGGALPWALPIIFPGALHPDIPWETQRANLVKGLRLAGEIAREHEIVLTLEPEDQYEQPHMAIHKCSEAFPIIEEVAHPNVKICFDIYHLQLSEGNITNNLKLGLQNDWIRLVQIGESPGRKEPGTGETDYGYIFRVLKAAGYTGYVDTEHGTTSTPEYAINVVKKLALQA
ncbi:MAG TPA: TIM barrel protein [Bryobacteraceae bacterium]|nr:TIM barrel protein [Bryobacteraceae bacterium]